MKHKFVSTKKTINSYVDDLVAQARQSSFALSKLS